MCAHGSMNRTLSRNKHDFIWESGDIYRQSLIFLPITKIILAISMYIWTLLSSQENIQPTFQ